MFARRFTRLAVVVLVACYPTCWATDNRGEDKEITVSSADSLEKSLAELIEQIRSNQQASSKDCSRLQWFVDQLGGDKLRAASADKQQEIVREILGAEHYKSVEDVLLAQMKSADPLLRDCAIRALGRGLFSASSKDVLKGIVFGPDRREQFSALTSLVALRTPGANHLLTVMLLSGTLTDIMAADAIGILLLSDKVTLANVGPAIISANKGPMAINALLPALRLRKDFKEIVAALFRSDIGRVPDEERLTLTNHVKLNLESDLLGEIFQNFSSYSNDTVVMKKIDAYAKSTSHFQLYSAALLILERSGEDVAYFERMLKDKTLPTDKANVLNLIIDRIRQGQRLGTEVAGSVKQTTICDANRSEETVSSAGSQPQTNRVSRP